MIRKDNQDCFIIERCEIQDCLVLALCDGMGGAKAGGVASQLSNKAFVSHIYGKLTARVQKRVDYQKMLTDACNEANGVSFEFSQFDEAFSGMGTTLVGGVIKYDGRGYIINVTNLNSNDIYQFEVSKDGVLIDQDGDGELDVPTGIQRGMVSMNTTSVSTLVFSDGENSSVTVPVLPPVGQ